MKSFDWTPNLPRNFRDALKADIPFSKSKRSFVTSVWNTGYTTPQEDPVDPIFAQRKAQANAQASAQRRPAPSSASPAGPLEGSRRAASGRRIFRGL